MDEIQQLREALKSAPDNLPLRKLLANALMKQDRHEEAEAEYKAALRLNAADTDLKIGLADAFRAQQKTGSGLVLIEELVEAPAPPAKAWLVYAKLLLQSQQAEAAKEAYENAIAINDKLRDAYLESEINLQIKDQPEPEKIKLKTGGNEGEDQDKSIDIERPETTFEDVGGMEQVKEEVRMKILHPLKHPEIYQAYGKKIGGGILLYGPPGCGKTHLARATAGEVGSNFLAVGISDILDMYIGQSERNLHAIFEKARSLKPCVLFFDEVDALGASRSDMRHSAGRNVINQFLAELDGVEYNNEGVLVLAATNAPWHLDAAFRRPGRFDRIIFVPPPDPAAREAILKLKLKGKPVSELNYSKLVKKTGDFSGADLEAIIDRAIEGKLAEAIRTGTPQPLQTKDLEQAIKKHRATTKEWFSTAKNYALFANEAGIYDEILDYLKIKK
ncbi:MAG: AAA family ATPase [Phaeodactylibacter xiamenensis]|uniref:Cell division protein n=1 Tax=Phaeodactylibacter xiamenensis TaxID=1524460 RepID=A0A098S078_9BACT|nr:ATP-binding protein [Phaeodactylibacter xiamenensis]KGE85218.1 cell division protein [Phaeodactylibacter xiamenensis]